MERPTAVLQAQPKPPEAAEGPGPLPALNASGNDGGREKSGRARAGEEGYFHVHSGEKERRRRDRGPRSAERKCMPASRTDSCLDFCFVSLTLLAYFHWDRDPHLRSAWRCNSGLAAAAAAAVQSRLGNEPYFGREETGRAAGKGRERSTPFIKPRGHTSTNPVASRQSPVGQIVRHALQSYPPLLVLTVNTLFLVFLPYMPLLN